MCMVDKVPRRHQEQETRKCTLPNQDSSTARSTAFPSSASLEPSPFPPKYSIARARTCATTTCFLADMRRVIRTADSRIDGSTGAECDECCDGGMARARFLGGASESLPPAPAPALGPVIEPAPVSSSPAAALAGGARPAAAAEEAEDADEDDDDEDADGPLSPQVESLVTPNPVVGSTAPSQKAVPRDDCYWRLFC